MSAIPRDPAFPGLPELLPAAGAPEFVAVTVRAMTRQAVRPEQGELAYFDYRPTLHCRIVWSFPTESGRPLMVSGHLFNDGEGSGTVADPAFQRLAERAALRLPLGSRSYTYVADRRLLLQVFPLDYKVPGLLAASCQQRMTEAFAGLYGCPAEAVAVDIVPVSYKPWRRCVFRYDVAAGGRRTRYYGKVFQDDRGEDMVPQLKALQAVFRQRGVRWDLPAPVMYLPDAHMLVLEAVHGDQELKSLLEQALHDPEARTALRGHVTAAAEGLIAFQQATVNGLPHKRTPEDLLDDLKEDSCFMVGLEEVSAGLPRSISRLIGALESESARLPPEPLGLVHGSFRHSHFLCRGDRLVLLDLDGLCLAGVSADAGNFLAYLDRTGLRRPRLRPVLAECEAAFREAWKGHPCLSPAWLDWHRAAAQLKWALRSFSSLYKNWLQTTAGLVALAEQTLAQVPAAGAAVI